MTAKEIRTRLQSLANAETAKTLQWFFKTGPGEYGEGDVFLGIKVPVLRKLVRDCKQFPVEEAVKLLRSDYHEERAIALMFLVRSYTKGTAQQHEQIFDLYLANSEWINNWDLVDTSAPHIVGQHLLTRDRKILYRLARSNSLWERRIAIISTFTFIRQNDFVDALKISALLLNDKEDLIHKAVGWMLREIGNREMQPEEEFLEQYANQMPRTMLRYAIEKFPEAKRQGWLIKSRTK